MNSPKSPVMTSTTSPLRESPRNTHAQGITPTNSWSTTSSTSPLRISKRDSPLTSDSIPNPHYRRLPTQLARRQSSSYNHVKNNALVSNSPFKTRSGVKPSRIPTPSRMADELENKPELGFKRRQSRGFQGLIKEQVVTKSPFLDKHSSVLPDMPPTPVPALPSHRIVSPYSAPPSESPLAQPLRAQSPLARSPTPPMLANPRNPRVADLSGITPSPSPSPKSSLVSSKRLRGPRSRSGSPTPEGGRRQRRKTVTFDERCDVLEFDQDEPSEEAVETDDEDIYGPPEPPSPAISPANESFSSCLSDQEPSMADIHQVGTMYNQGAQDVSSDMDHPGRTPHISRDDIRRRLMESRVENLEEHPDFSSPQPTPDASFDLSHHSDLSSRHAESPRAQVATHDHVSRRSHSPAMGMGAPFDFNRPGVDLGDMHSALDRFMLGVESGFGLSPAEGESMETGIVTEGDMSFNADASTMDTNAHTDVETQSVEAQPLHPVEKQPEVGRAEVTETMSTDEDTDEPVTPPVDDHCAHLPPTPNKDDSVLHGAPPIEESLPGTPTPAQGDHSILSADSGDISNSNVAGVSSLELSVAELGDEGLDVHTSSPPRSARKDQPYAVEPRLELELEPSESLLLPPLSFGPPSPETSITAHTARDPNPAPVLPSRLPTIVKDDTFLVRHSSISSNGSVPPPVPPKDDPRMHRGDAFSHARRDEMEIDYHHERPVTYLQGRPSKRRSLSTGDAEDLGSSKPAAQRRADRLRDDRDTTLLEVPLEPADAEDALSDVIARELKLRRTPTVKETKRKYQLRERGKTIYASSDDKVSHMRQAGDVDSGKAWRTVRRPSDMNEYSRQIKEYRSQQKPGKAHGKVFVKVLGVRGLNVPLPNHPTAFTCTLNNGIHFVTTPECRLGRDSRIEQEFELIEHSKLEFTLTLTVRRDPHILAQVKSNAMPLPTPIAPAPPPPAPRSGVRSFFGVGGSPKKAHKISVAVAARATPEPIEDNLARYLKPDGTLARAFISFREIAKRCDARLFETSFPLIGQRTDGSSASPVVNPWSVGEILLQIFRLPPLPGIQPDQLPQSLEECHRGLRHINWHKVTYHEGVLTQNGGDCRTWRRRLLRVIGSNLVAFNDVTKKATATIDLKKAIAVEDDDRASEPMRSPASARSRDEFDDIYGVERSFRLVFPNGEEITFFADNDESKARWLEVLRALVGHIPPNPLWAELVWQRQEDLAKSAASTSPALSSPNPASRPKDGTLS